MSIQLRRCTALGLAFCFTACLPRMVAAADPPAAATGPVISAENAHLLQPLRELNKDVFQIRRGPKREQLAVMGWQKPIEVLDDVEFKTVQMFAEHAQPCNFSLSRDGGFIAWSVNDQNGVTIQDVLSGELNEMESNGAQSSCAFSPDGFLRAVGGYGQHIKLWNPAGVLMHTLETGAKGGLTPVFSPDGKILAVGNRNDETRLFEVATGELLHKLPKRMTQELAFSPDGKVLAVGYVNGDVGLWDVETGELLNSSPSGAAEIYTVDWSPKGDVLVTAGQKGTVVLWEPETLAKLHELECPEWLIQVRFTSDGKRLLTAGGSIAGDKKDRRIVVWSIADDK